MTLLSDKSTFRLAIDTKFMMAAYMNDSKTIASLLKDYKEVSGYGFDANISLKGWIATPIGFLAAHGNLDLVRHLVDHHRASLARVSGTNITPLMMAVDAEQYEMAEYILGKNVPLDIFSDHRKGILDYARTAKMTDLLIEYGVNLNTKHFEAIYNPLQLAIMENRYDVALTLVAAGADIHCRSPRDLGLLHLLSFQQNPPKELFQLLLVKGLPINELDGEKVTPLFYAIKHGNVELARYLVSVGADISMCAPLFQTSKFKSMFPEFATHSEDEEWDHEIERDR